MDIIKKEMETISKNTIIRTITFVQPLMHIRALSTGPLFCLT